MSDPIKIYIERVEQTKAVQITDETQDHFRFLYQFSNYKLESKDGEITFTFERDGEDQNLLVVPWGDYVIVTSVMASNPRRRKYNFQVVAQHDFEEKFVEDKFPLTDGEMQFLRHLYVKNVEEAKRLRDQGVLPRNP